MSTSSLKHTQGILNLFTFNLGWAPFLSLFRMCVLLLLLHCWNTSWRRACCKPVPVSAYLAPGFGPSGFFWRCRADDVSHGDMHFLKRETITFIPLTSRWRWISWTNGWWASAVVMGSCTTLSVCPIKYSKTVGPNAWALPVKHENYKYKICRSQVTELEI